MMRPASLADALFTPHHRAELREAVDLAPGVICELADPASRAVLADVEILLTGWGAPVLTPAQLARMPRLRAVIHAGGVARQVFGFRDVEPPIAASNSGYANSIPVAEFTLALVLLSGKSVLETAARYRTEQDRIDKQSLLMSGGNFRRTVGIVGASRVGRLLIGMLRPFSLDVVVYDPFLDAAEAAGLGVESVSLDDLLRRSDVVSLHVPVLPSTTKMIGRRELSLIRTGATLINTARGAIVDQAALVEELRTGRIRAYLDTTDPELLPGGHELYALPNVLLTPHIAGSAGTELQRLGANVVAETKRFVAGEPFAYPEHLGAVTPH
jgi:phosphoglycerate dehydrogenase-like enzyme